MTKEDRVLVEAAQRDPRQFDALYRIYFQTIYDYFWYRVGHDHDVAEDLTQDVFVRAFKGLHRFSYTGASYRSYLLTVAHNILVNYYRKEKPIPLDTVPDIPVEIWDDIEKEDRLQRLWREIQKLPIQERDILYLFHRRGYSVREIASITKKTENAVKLTLSRARKKLKDTETIQRLDELAPVVRTPSTPRYYVYLEST